MQTNSYIFVESYACNCNVNAANTKLNICICYFLSILTKMTTNNANGVKFAKNSAKLVLNICTFVTFKDINKTY